ncbi:vascular cell adhesion protein 1 isoform X2 [Carettochelys insculpta]|uniref:vascular cell adhesion protein 1 isoform X2 n=1 Tax=Carettochelys insculpta TaxID=44489 RepID=UPI003EB72C51
MGRIIPSVTGLLLVFVTSHTFKVHLVPENKVAAQIGDKLELICSTIDCKSPTFSWRTQLDNPLGGTVNNNGSRSILTMDPVGFSNEHEYLCTASCDNEKKEKSTTIDIYSFPSDPIIEFNTSLYVGEKASVTCTIPNVYPSDLLTMQLEKDGSVLDMKEFYNEPRTETTETKRLMWTFIPTFEDAGKEIACVAELPMEEVDFEPKKRQTSQRLSVNFGPQNTNIVVSPSNTIMQGETLMLTCKTTSNPLARVVWKKELANSSAQHVIDNDTIIIPHAQMSDSGLFICEAMNEEMNKTERATVVISVQDGPRNTTVSVTPSNTVREGDTVIMTCTSNGNPSPEVSWTKHLISGESQFLSKDATLTIKNAKADDLGLYVCAGVNQFGREKKTVELIVQVPPKDTVLSVFPSDTVKEGENVTFTCTAEGVPAVQIILKKKTQGADTMIVSESGSYHIYRAQLEDAGLYECESRNKLGQQFQNQILEVKAIVKRNGFLIPVIVVLSCLSIMAIPALAVWVYVSRKGRVNGSYSIVNAPKPNV